MSDKKIDRASDVEFSQAIADAIEDMPSGNNKTQRHVLAAMGVGYILGKAVKNARKN